MITLEIRYFTSNVFWQAITSQKTHCWSRKFSVFQIYILLVQFCLKNKGYKLFRGVFRKKNTAFMREKNEPQSLKQNTISGIVNKTFTV